MYSITKKTSPSDSWPKSVTSQMKGLPIFEAARASLRKRSTASGSRALDASSVLSATRFSRSTCSAW
jgi:hypothetical protein